MNYTDLTGQAQTVADWLEEALRYAARARTLAEKAMIDQEVALLRLVDKPASFDAGKVARQVRRLQAGRRRYGTALAKLDETMRFFIECCAKENPAATREGAAFVIAQMQSTEEVAE